MASCSRHRAVTLGLALSLSLAGCATSRAIAPLDKGQHGVSVSLGGPMVEFGGAPVPLPFVGLGYRYGIDGKTDLHAAIYPSGPVLVGVMGWDVGVAREVLAADGPVPRIMVDLNTTWTVGDNGPGGDPAAFRFFATPSAVFTWDLGPPKHRVYVGADVFFQPAPSVRAIPSVFLGSELQASEVVGLQLELGWTGFHRHTDVGAVTWIGPGQQGAIAVRLGVNVRIPRPAGVRSPEAPAVAGVVGASTAEGSP